MPKSKTEKPKWNFPKDLSACLKLLAESEKKLAVVEAKAQPVVTENKALREHMLDTFKKKDLDGIRGSGIVLSLVRSVSPTVEDWVAFLKYAVKKGNDDLLQRSVNVPAWRARVEQKVAVPGTGTFDRVSLRVNKDSRG